MPAMHALTRLLLILFLFLSGCEEPLSDAAEVEESDTSQESPLGGESADALAVGVEESLDSSDASESVSESEDVALELDVAAEGEVTFPSDADDAHDSAAAEAEGGIPTWPLFSALPLPAPPWFHQVRLSDIELDDNGESEDIFVELPEETTSVFVMARGEESAFLTLKKAITPPPFSESIVKGPGEHLCVPCKNRVASAQHIGSFLLPNDPDVAVKGGEWTFKVRATHRVEDITQGLVFLGYPSTCEVTILARTEAVPDTGVLPVRLHFTGSHGLSAESAPEDERRQSALDILSEIYALAGVAIQIAGYHDIAGVEDDPSLTDVGSTAGFPNDLSKLFLSGYDEDPAALNIFFVNSIYKDVDYEEVGGIVLGIAGGVPGPAYLGPSYRSGVAIATFEISENDHLGNVMAHEIGHYLGLFHSTEKNAIFHDTLDDTEEDDGENLMFWGWSENQMALSESQSFVLRSHPMVMPDKD